MRETPNVKLSVILVAHNMHREIPRTLQSLAPDYQVGAEDMDYEVLVVDNGSSQRPDPGFLDTLPGHCRYHYLEDPPPSPAYALNYGMVQSTGEVLCLMIDGAHLLSPGVLSYALAAFRAYPSPVVMTRCFFMGPGDQNDTVLEGYNQQVEDGLMQQINWPEDGYRLFEVGSPQQGHVPKIGWFNRMIESNCLFMRREIFHDIGGANERFDLPGGGFLNLDLYREAAEHPATQVVQLIGEGSFHQFHGGTTTNVSPQERDAKVLGYKAQYEAIRCKEFDVSPKDVQYLGHLPTRHSKIHLRNRGKPNKPIPEDLRAAILGES